MYPGFLMKSPGCSTAVVLLISQNPLLIPLLGLTLNEQHLASLRHNIRQSSMERSSVDFLNVWLINDLLTNVRSV